MSKDDHSDSNSGDASARNASSRSVDADKRAEVGQAPQAQDDQTERAELSPAHSPAAAVASQEIEDTADTSLSGDERLPEPRALDDAAADASDLKEEASDEQPGGETMRETSAADASETIIPAIIDDSVIERPSAEAVERHTPPDTALMAALKSAGQFALGTARLLSLTLFYLPILLAAFLMMDLPYHGLDRYFLSPALRPSAWLSWGALAMGLAPLVAILLARRYGGDEASKVVTAAWGVAALAVFAEVSRLAPSLGAGDYPAASFVAAIVVSAMGGQFVAIGVYDVIRGGGRWWRAPLYAAMTGFAVQSFIYFPVVYWGAAAPWANWMVSDLAIKFAFAVCFLPLYFVLRNPLRPRGGFGGV